MKYLRVCLAEQGTCWKINVYIIGFMHHIHSTTSSLRFFKQLVLSSLITANYQHIFPTHLSVVLQDFSDQRSISLEPHKIGPISIQTVSKTGNILFRIKKSELYENSILAFYLVTCLVL